MPDSHAPLCRPEQVALHTAIFVALGLIPVAVMSFTAELRARQRHAALHHMSREGLGPFWSCCFDFSGLLTSAGHLPLCRLESLHRD